MAMPDPWLMLCDRNLDRRIARFALVRRLARDVPEDVRHDWDGARDPALVLCLRPCNACRRGVEFGRQRGGTSTVERSFQGRGRGPERPALRYVAHKLKLTRADGSFLVAPRVPVRRTCRTRNRFFRLSRIRLHSGALPELQRR